MNRTKTPLELYKLLPGTNCGQCGVPGCMAFAVAIFKAEKHSADCPYLEIEISGLQAGGTENRQGRDSEQRAALTALQKEVARLDLTRAARRVGGTMVDGGLAVRCLVRDFVVDAAGTISSECHIIPWVQYPLLNYLIHCRGQSPAGEWISFGELAAGPDWRRYFSHRCEAELRQLADTHGDLFFELLELFGGTQEPGGGKADQSMVLRPLPKLPLLINYWARENLFDSTLNILFDRSAADNLHVEAIYYLTRGLVEMFRQLIPRHTRDGRLF